MPRYRGNKQNQWFRVEDSFSCCNPVAIRVELPEIGACRFVRAYSTASLGLAASFILKGTLHKLKLRPPRGEAASQSTHVSCNIEAQIMHTCCTLYPLLETSSQAPKRTLQACPSRQRKTRLSWNARWVEMATVLRRSCYRTGHTGRLTWFRLLGV